MKPTHIISLLLLWLTATAQAAPTITVSCPDTVRVNEQFWYEVTLKARSYRSAEGLVFPLGMELLTHKYIKEQERNEEDEDEVINTLVMRFSLRATSMGVFTLPQVNIVAESKKLVSQLHKVVVLPEKKYESEYLTAFNLLKGKGIEADSLHLKLTTYGNNIVLFSDYDTDCFAAVATQRCAKLMNAEGGTSQGRERSVNGGGVLAWSTEGAMRSPDQGGPEWIFKSYDEQLSALAKRTAQPYKGAGGNANVKPLLGKTAWGQGAPYNALCPATTIVQKPTPSRGKKKAKGAPRLVTQGTLAGCGPVAMGQVMMYHKYPAKGQGKRAYNNNGALRILDLEQQALEWSKIYDSYDDSETDPNVITPIARLIISAGVATEANFGKERTSTSASMYRSALVNNFGYAASTHSISDGKPTDRIRVAIDELKAARPMIVACSDHSFVLDGIQGDFMHYNMGWAGLANGWYRTLITEDGDLAFKTMVVGIKPGTQDTQLKKEVHVEKPGTLEALLTAQEVATTTHLTVTGKLNNADVRLLRRMAGAVESNNWNETRGCLTQLDLTRAQFITDRDGYFMRLPANSYKAWHTVTSSKTVNGEPVPGSQTTTREDFDFAHMTPEKWERFKSLGLHENDSYYLSKDGNEYYINCHTQDKQVSCYMWKECENLRNILLPGNTKSIGDHAFANCTSLLRLDIPAQCTHLGREVFAYCIAIEAVTYTRLADTPDENLRNALYKANLLTTSLTKRSE